MFIEIDTKKTKFQTKIRNNSKETKKKKKYCVFSGNRKKYVYLQIIRKPKQKSVARETNSHKAYYLTKIKQKCIFFNLLILFFLFVRFEERNRKNTRIELFFFCFSLEAEEPSENWKCMEVTMELLGN